jgi:hypothetical protein
MFILLMLTKINNNNYILGHYLFNGKKPEDYNTDSLMLDYRLRIRNDYNIPIKFIDKVFIVNKNSFIQNNINGNNLRKDIINKLKFNNIEKIITIGGEAYLYGVYLNINTINITNNINIYNDANRHNLLGNNYVDYNKIKSIPNDNQCIIINLSKLIVNLLNIINKSQIKLLIIISCHHDDFWKKIKYLSNYKLVERKQYIYEYNFITVNYFRPIIKFE